MDKLLTPVEVARWVGVTPGTARSWMADGKVPGAFPHGATYLVFEQELKAALEDGRVGVRAEPEGNGPRAITSREAHKMLAEKGITISHVTVLDWLRRGILPGRRVGKAWAVDRVELERMLDAGFETPKRGRPSADESHV
jgi:excisionase family DNA binding protein